MSSIYSTAAEYLPFLPRPAAKLVGPTGRPVHGLIAAFDSTPAVVHAAEMVRDAGYKRWDVNSPFPIHGIEESMGFRKTSLPYLVFGAGLSGAFAGWLLQYWMSAVDYEIVVQGKPYGAWEPLVPIIFEMGVLGAAFTALLGMLALNGLPRFHHPLFNSSAFLKTSDDRFVIAVEASDKRFDPDETRALLERAGGTEIQIIEDDA